MKKEISIVGLLVDQRAEHAPDVQRILSDFGRCVLGRFGIPAHDENHGLITLVMECDEETSRQLIQRLEQIPALSLNHMQVTRQH
ncbi:MAG: hypothetical protein DDT37_01312 [Firmicutes bacterium]|nr:hypothetical protein [candidate division NPL-UPA2 bacterium]MBT9156327.1 hypothetical protein [candidate division NPL-UPA2 bacterium]